MFLTRDREQVSHVHGSDADQDLESSKMRNGLSGLHVDGDESVRSTSRAVNRSIAFVDKNAFEGSQTQLPQFMRPTRPLLRPGRCDGNWGALSNDGKASNYDHRGPDNDVPNKMRFATVSGRHTAPLFLQELPHLASWSDVIALSTLRNNVEDAESSLDCNEPGSPWPEVDPLKCPT